MATILVIDDHQGCRQAMERLLRFEGHQVYSADTIWKGLAILETHPIDLVLLDLDLPRGNGQDFLRDLEANALRQSVPVVIVSAKDFEPTIWQAHRRHLRDWLTKADFSGDQLLSCVERHARRGQNVGAASAAVAG